MTVEEIRCVCVCVCVFGVLISDKKTELFVYAISTLRKWVRVGAGILRRFVCS